ncbi:divalent-cation tolerance protein CutA [Thalassotalea marina]|uniref:Divalent-cation tolerance protein CutA n=1 Tax=Thalassotalea marina TaxID=1673741 RepID=A0A919BP34_9GAMM|nr:divalent-cation tolerance protein CutA [Thalassotalea marina]GHG04442.1 divalent-cation tolerance protein CutA [Thalassotalea marina]
MYQIVLCNCPNDEIASQIAKHLVELKLAACVNVIPGVRSVYQWQGKIEIDHEVQLIIKTRQSLFEQLSREITQLHPYDVPEIIAMEIAAGNHAYLQWLEESLTHDDKKTS